MCHCGKFRRLRFDTGTRDNVAQILQATFAEETFGALEEELVMEEGIQNLFQMVKMGLQGITVDEYIVEEDRREFTQEWL